MHAHQTACNCLTCISQCTITIVRSQQVSTVAVGPQTRVGGTLIDFRLAGLTREARGTCTRERVVLVDAGRVVHTRVHLAGARVIKLHRNKRSGM